MQKLKSKAGTLWSYSKAHLSDISWKSINICNATSVSFFLSFSFYLSHSSCLSSFLFLGLRCKCCVYLAARKSFLTFFTQQLWNGIQSVKVKLRFLYWPTSEGPIGCRVRFNHHRLMFTGPPGWMAGKEPFSEFTGQEYENYWEWGDGNPRPLCEVLESSVSHLYLRPWPHLCMAQ